MNLKQAIVVITALTVSCAETGQDRTNIPLFVAGTDVSAPVIAAFDIPITLDRADVAFGPLYLCAGATAGDLCDSARLEWLGTVVVDATADEPALAGELVGVTGTVRSWMYDLGISSQLTRSEPFALGAATELGGASFVVEGRAIVDGVELPFSASVPLRQTDDTELGVPVIRKSTSESFFRDVGSDESGLLVRFDPAAWVRRLDLRPYVTAVACTPSGPVIACDRTLEQTCKEGVEISRRDCGDLGQVCLPGEGCKERLTFQSDSEAFRALHNGLTSGGRPTFEWDHVPQPLNRTATHQERNDEIPRTELVQPQSVDAAVPRPTDSGL